MAAHQNEFGDFNVVHPEDYAARGYPHDVWTRMRAQAPVYRWEATDGMPFWAITRHADIIHISNRPDTFLNAPRLVISHLTEDPPMDGFPPTLIQMDPPRHRAFRKMLSHQRSLQLRW